MRSAQHGFVPALGYRRLTALYDPLLRWTMREERFKRDLLRQAGIQAGHRVLDVGCGTGTLALMAKRAVPGAEVVGLDADPTVLEIARRKAARAGLRLGLERGNSSELPYLDGSFDRVLSSLLFHHLDREAKAETMREVLRVLRPRGEMHLADWGRPRNATLRVAFLLVRLLDGLATTRDNARGILPELIRAAGFGEVRVEAAYATLFGSLYLYSARKTAASLEGGKGPL